MDVIFGLIAVAVVVLVGWDRFTRNQRGRALAFSVAALLVILGAGVARGADVAGPWALAGLVLGGVLLIVTDRVNEDSPRGSSGR